MGIGIDLFELLTFITLVAIYLLDNIVVLLPSFESLNLFEEVCVRVGLFRLRRVRVGWAIRSFPHQLVREVEEAIHLNNSTLCAGSLWLGVHSPFAIHMKDKKSNKQRAGQVHNKNKCTHSRWCV